jgi:hypothetical protein
MALGPTRPLIQWVPGALSLGVKRPGREADHSPPPSAKVKSVCGSTSPLPQYAFMAWGLVKHILQQVFLQNLLVKMHVMSTKEAMVHVAHLATLTEHYTLYKSGPLTGFTVQVHL